MAQFSSGHGSSPHGDPLADMLNSNGGGGIPPPPPPPGGGSGLPPMHSASEDSDNGTPPPPVAFGGGGPPPAMAGYASPPPNGFASVSSVYETDEKSQQQSPPASSKPGHSSTYSSPNPVSSPFKNGSGNGVGGQYVPRESHVRRQFSDGEPIERRRGKGILNPGRMASLDSGDRTEKLIKDVGFTPLLRQVDVGIEMMEHLKEVIRKFAKHQNADASKLLEIYTRLPPNYKSMEGMTEFASLCDLTYQLIMETVKAQRKLSDYLASKVVPTMTRYIEEKKQKVQQIKRQNQQSELKLNSCINTMKKNANSARNAAKRAKQSDPTIKANGPGSRQSRTQSTGKPSGLSSLGSMMKGWGSKKKDGMSEGEHLYKKAEKEDHKYKAAVMTANHEQGVYVKIVDRFKHEINELEVSRMRFGVQQISTFVQHHRQMFSNDRIVTLQTQVASSLDSLNPEKEFDNFLKKAIDKHGQFEPPRQFEYKRPDFQNIFYSLQDAIDVTRQGDPHAVIPRIMTALCERIRELKGFALEGIFRISASSVDLEKLRASLNGGNYNLMGIMDAHICAGMLKEWLRGMNDSLIPRSHYDICISMAKDPKKLTREKLQVFLSQLPEVNRETIRYLIAFLKELLKPEYVQTSRMNLENVAIVFAPTVLCCPSSDPSVLMMNSKHEKTFLMQLMSVI